MYKQFNEWRTHLSYLCTALMEVFDVELWAIGLMLRETVKRRDRLQKHRVKTLAVLSDQQAPIQRTANLEWVPGQRLLRRIDPRARAFRAHGIATEIHRVQGHSIIPWNKEADCQANLAQDASGSIAKERPYTSASIRPR